MAYEQRNTKEKEHWLKLKDEALRKHKSGEPLSLEETSLAIWNPDTEDYPMTSMGVLKIEKKALAKLKIALKKKNITGIDDLFESKFREYAKPISSIYSK